MSFDEILPNRIPCPHQHFRTNQMNRSALSPKDHIALLATPRGYRWQGTMPPDFTGPKAFSLLKPVRRKNQDDQKSIDVAEQRYIHQFLSQILPMMSPEMTNRLKRMLIQEFGMSYEEAGEFVKLQNSKDDSTKTNISEVDVHVKAHWLKEFERLLTAKITDYIVSMMCARRSNRVETIAENLLFHIGDLTGERCNLDDPQNMTQRIQVFLAERFAVWLANLLEKADKEICKEFKQQPPEKRKKKKTKKKSKVEKKTKLSLEQEKKQQDIDEQKKKELEEQRRLEIEKQRQKELDEQKRKELEQQKLKELEEQKSKKPGDQSQEDEEQERLEEEKRKKEEEERKKEEERRKMEEEERKKEEEERRKEEEERKKKEMEQKEEEERRKKEEEEERLKKEEQRQMDEKKQKEDEEQELKELEEKEREEEEKRKKEEEEQRKMEEEQRLKELEEKEREEEKDQKELEDEKEEEEEQLQEEIQEQKSIEEILEEQPEETIVEAEIPEPEEKEEVIDKLEEFPGVEEGPEETETGVEETEQEKIAAAGDVSSRDPLEKVKHWIEESEPAETESQDDIRQMVESQLKKSMGDVSPEEEEAIRVASKKTSAFVDRLAAEAKNKLHDDSLEVSTLPSPPKPKTKATYYIKKIKEGCYYNVKRIEDKEMIERTRVARSKKVAILPESICNRPKNLKPVKNLSEMKEWAKWATDVVSLCEKWASWISRISEEVQAEDTKEGDCEGRWRKFKETAEMSGLELKRNKKYVKETSKAWTEKLKKIT